MLTGVRTQELRFARWEDIDFETKLWEIPAEVMKMKRPHIVPLSEQVIALFKQLEPISNIILWSLSVGTILASQLVRKALTKSLNCWDIREDSQGTVSDTP